MPRVRVQIEGLEVVVEGDSGRPQTPPPGASSPSSTGSFTLVDLPPAARSPLAGYLPELESLPTRVNSAPRGRPEAPGSSATYLPETASSSLPPPFLASFVVPEYPLLGPEPQASEPPAVVADTARFLSACNLSPRSRIARAWRAGVSASRVLSGQVDFTDKTPWISARNRVYCVLRTRAVSEPRVLRTFVEYKAVPGILERQGSVSHAFLSEYEARAYFAGAGLPFPN